ncbi:hypothetical protein BD410DRAFT_405396 [Rickenella mellea]|uniref:Uncharacterized protein n=1 Tax=Rickenella mellea TaxID=50990 RepID=A0A4Y7QIW6_9AGAM|nr:hypothetical protein BD410DRAFT_405396 [Rickenella mellea]
MGLIGLIDIMDVSGWMKGDKGQRWNKPIAGDGAQPLVSSQPIIFHLAPFKAVVGNLSAHRVRFPGGDHVFEGNLIIELAFWDTAVREEYDRLRPPRAMPFSSSSLSTSELALAIPPVVSRSCPFLCRHCSFLWARRCLRQDNQTRRMMLTAQGQTTVSPERGAASLGRLAQATSKARQTGLT